MTADNPWALPGNQPWQTPSTPAPVQPGALTPSALRVLSELLNIGGERPVTPPALPAQLRDTLQEGTREALEGWTERSLWVSKSALFSVERCEASFVADRSAPRSGLNRALAVGQVSHQAIQIAHTHPGQPVEVYIKSAIAAQEASDQPFREFWTACDIAVQSDVISGALSKVTAFLDSWPPLAAEWTPRFEDPTQVKVGKLTISIRPDLVLGRPRPDLRQTMFITDFKTGDLKDEHEREALLYALVSTIRYGVAPYRSCVYSLASGDWVAPEVNTETLSTTAEWVAAQVSAMAQVLGDRRPPVENVNSWCSWCVRSSQCQTFAASQLPAPKEPAPLDL